MRTDNFINYKISTNNIHITDSFQYTTKKDERNNSVFEKNYILIILYLQDLFHH